MLKYILDLERANKDFACVFIFCLAVKLAGWLTGFLSLSSELNPWCGGYGGQVGHDVFLRVSDKYLGFLS